MGLFPCQSHNGASYAQVRPDGSSAGLLRRSAWAHDGLTPFYREGQIQAKAEFILIIYSLSMKYKIAYFLCINLNLDNTNYQDWSMTEEW